MTDQIIRMLLAHGTMGLVAGLLLWLYLAEKGEHKTTRDKAAADLRAINQEKQTLVEAHAAQERALLEQINDLREAHATREQACLQTVEYFAKAQVEAVEELGRIAQALRKAYDRLRR